MPTVMRLKKDHPYKNSSSVGAACGSIQITRTICQHVAPLELKNRCYNFFYKHRAPNGAFEAVWVVPFYKRKKNYPLNLLDPLT